MSEADYKTVAELLDKAGFRTNPRNSNGLRRQSSFITGMQMLTGVLGWHSNSSIPATKKFKLRL